MATVIPRNEQPAIEFLNARARAWLEPGVAARIGLTPAEVEHLAALAHAAEQAAAAARRAREEARAATLTLHNALAAARAAGSAAIERIRLHAASAHGEGDDTLAAAGLPATAHRRAPLPPAQPEIVSAVNEGDGAVTIRWRTRHTAATRAAGTVYSVERAVAGSRQWTVLGIVGGREKRFTDDALPAVPPDAPAVRYRIIPRRAGLRGEPSAERWVVVGPGIGAQGQATGDGEPRATRLRPLRAAC